MALQKFLFVGIGGSGGLTISVLRHILQLQLEARGYYGGIPKAWQFVNVDVAASQGGETDGIRLLPDREYLGLTKPLLEHREEDPYRHLDEMVSACGQQVRDHVVGWRPNRDHVRVDVTKGAGQFRAIGRLVLGAMMSAAHERLKGALSELTSQETNTEFARVSQALTGDNRVSGEAVQAVVITSLAGGSGSGQVSDVCDLIRKLDPAVARQLAAILYAPDVFSDLKESERYWINPNALATISELLNGHWNNEKADPAEFALLSAAGGAVGDDVRMRGPRLMYVVGRANGSLKFSKQYDVYRAVGRALAAWATSAQLQARFRQYELGNVTTQAQRRDSTNLKEDGNENPLSSLGFASIGIGLERFARYSAERLAREAVEHLLTGHWPIARRREMTEKTAREARAQEVVDQFLDDCGLRELARDGQGHPRQITDAIRGLSSDESRDRVRALVLDRLVGQVTDGTPRNGLARDEVVRRIVNRTSENLDADVAEITREYIPNAARWAEGIQERVAQATGRLIAAQGAPVVHEVLQITISRLRDHVASSLHQDVRRYDQQVAEFGQSALRRLTTAGPFLPSNPFIRDSAEAAVDTVHARCEQALAQLCAPLVEDLAVDLLAPLRDAVGGARDALQADFDGTPERPSLVKSWPASVVPTALEPAPNELLLEPVEGYPGLFDSLIVAEAEGGHTAIQNALAQARREVISGERERADLTPIVVESIGRWVPRDGRLREGPSASPAGFAVRTRAEQLLARARTWIRRPDSSFGVYLRQTLEDYLDPKGVGDHVGLQRRSAFERLLAEARRTSAPFVELDSATYTRVHGSFPSMRSLLTPFPFPPGHPARAIVTDVFADYNEGELGSLFGDDPTGRLDRIDIFTFLSSPVQPMVMHSLVGPIKDQWASVSRSRDEGSRFWTWRRARPLPWFVPCAPAVRRAMVCGWFVARFLGYIPDVNPNREATRIFCPQVPGAYAEFPLPLLGPPVPILEEWLPAVLESLVLCLIGHDLTPYHRLRGLGIEVMAPTELGSATELLRWINLGQVPAGAGTPDEQTAGPADGGPDLRRAALRETTRRYLNNFAQFPGTRLTASGSEAPRAWELREDILLALSAIEAVTDLPTEAALGGLG